MKSPTRRAAPRVDTLVLRLYVAGEAPHSARAVERLHALCDAHCPGNYTLEVVDALRAPLRALADGILVTPTLLKLAPGPQQTILGDLQNLDAVTRALGLKGADV